MFGTDCRANQTWGVARRICLEGSALLRETRPARADDYQYSLRTTENIQGPAQGHVNLYSYGLGGIGAGAGAGAEPGGGRGKSAEGTRNTRTVRSSPAVTIASCAHAVAKQSGASLCPRNCSSDEPSLASHA